MQRKIYVAGMMSEDCEKKVNAAVSAVTGIANCVANSSKAQVLVDYDESVAGIDDAINAAIESCGYTVLA